MTDFKNIKFSGTDIVKLIGFVGMVGSMWLDLKTDQIEFKKDREFLQYQIDELRVKCGIAAAVKPKEVKIETE